MFTVCPKCALTLVVTAADLRVAQGYVRCGRCSNVFNAIVGLSEDRSGGNAAQPSTATTSIIRKAPSIAEEDAPRDTLSDTGETEAIYAEPEADSQEVTFQEVFIEAPAPTPAAPPARTNTPPPPANRQTKAPAPPPAPAPSARSTPPAAPKAPAPGVAQSRPAAPAPKPAPPPAPKAPPPQETYPAFSDSIPDTALEFNPEATDVSQVFIEAAPAKKIDIRAITGQFEQIKLPPEPPPPAPAPPPRQPPPRQQAAPAPPPPPPRRQRDSDDDQLEDDLRSLAARLDATGRQPALRVPPPPQPPASKPAATPAPPSRPKRQPSEDVIVYQGSPYNSADASSNVARKAAATAARRRLAPPAPVPAGPAPLFDDDEEFDAPLADQSGAYSAAASFIPKTLSRKQRMAWISGAAALCVVLGAQAIHHNRHDLATKATLNRPLTSFYKAIGVSLVPRWNLALYDVRQLGAFSAGADDGNLTVRASLKNSSDQPLPLPLLRITVQDRYGNRIATRDVPPKDYVPGALPSDAHLGAGQRIDAEMSFKDPGRDAVGFEIDACLPTPEGRISCAGDVPGAPR